MHVHLDPLGGLAGDMFLAALLHAWPEHFDGALTAIRAAGVPDGVRVSLMPHHDHTFQGNAFRVESIDAVARPAGAYRDVRERLVSSDLAPSVRERALAIFRLLAKAEGAVHGVATENVVFHEVAGWDSVVDIVGAAFVLDALPVESWSVAAIPMGGGRVDTAHGPLPVPAPATVELLHGFEMIDDGVLGERVTPTGAAILRHLEPSAGLPAGPWSLRTKGTGFGQRKLAGISNIVRVLSFERETRTQQRETVTIIAFEVDDQTPEDLAVGLDRLRSVAGVLDVVQMPVFGKKNRLMVSVRVLCQPAASDRVIDACFTETTTIGVRYQTVERATLTRSQVLDGDVKLVERPSGRTAKLEIEAVKDLAGGTAARNEARQDAETHALKQGDG